MTFRPMTAAEFPAFRRRFIADWAKDLAMVNELSRTDALQLATARRIGEVGKGYEKICGMAHSFY